MRTMKFKSVWQSAGGITYSDVIEVQARNVNSGFRKAAKLATEGLPMYAEVVSLTFWQAD